MRPHDPDELHDSLASGDGPYPSHARDYHSHLSRIRVRSMMQEMRAYGNERIARICEGALDGDDDAARIAAGLIRAEDERAEDDLDFL